MALKNRIQRLEYVRAGDLLPDPRNYRRHPKAQRDALETMLGQVGYADAVIARETPDGLMLVDGHLRAGLDSEQSIPVLVTDLDEAEAGAVLATLDPLAAMAEADTQALTDLLDGLAGSADEAMREFMAGVHGLEDLQASETGWPERERQPEHNLGIMTFVVSESQRQRIAQALRDASHGAPDEADGNENSNGIALWVICEEWLARKT